MNINNVPKNIRSVMDNETPFRVISIDDFELRLYWTPTRGVAGYQCIGVVWGPYNEQTESCLVAYAKTGGGGYCKESDMLGRMFKAIGIKPKGMVLGGQDMNYDYKVGGNFYRVPKKDIRKA